MGVLSIQEIKQGQITVGFCFFVAYLSQHLQLNSFNLLKAVIVTREV